jgi:hypothetical protein
VEYSADEPRSLAFMRGTRVLRRWLARSVLATQDPLLHRREDNLADAELLAGRYHIGLDDAIEGVVTRLIGDKRDAELRCQRVASRI